MSDELDLHSTDGFHYRTPADPKMIAALGRAVWNFHTTEETAVAILYEVGTRELGPARKLNAGDKESCLRRAQKQLREHGAPPALLDSLDRGIKDFSIARSKYRNGIAHAGHFTAEITPDGIARPGILLNPKGQKAIVVKEPEELHAIAKDIEDLRSSLGQARRAIREFLQSSQQST